MLIKNLSLLHHLAMLCFVRKMLHECYFIKLLHQHMKGHCCLVLDLGLLLLPAADCRLMGADAELCALPRNCTVPYADV